MTGKSSERPAAAQRVLPVAKRPLTPLALRRLEERVEPPQGRSFDPDWSPGLVLLAVAWFALVGIGAWFFWSAVA